jgi:hypothetical protein
MKLLSTLLSSNGSLKLPGVLPLVELSKVPTLAPLFLSLTRYDLVVARKAEMRCLKF